MSNVDERILAGLRGLAGRLDPIPDDVRQRAHDALAWRTVGTDLAQLSYDSVLDDELLVGVRGTGPRQLSFEGPTCTVEIEIHRAAGRLVGQVVPPGPAEIVVRAPTGSVRARADDLGRFIAEPVGTGPISILCTADSGNDPTVTEWVVI